MCSLRQNSLSFLSKPKAYSPESQNTSAFNTNQCGICNVLLRKCCLQVIGQKITIVHTAEDEVKTIRSPLVNFPQGCLKTPRKKVIEKEFLEELYFSLEVYSFLRNTFLFTQNSHRPEDMAIK